MRTRLYVRYQSKFYVLILSDISIIKQKNETAFAIPLKKQLLFICPSRFYFPFHYIPFFGIKVFPVLFKQIRMRSCSGKQKENYLCINSVHKKPVR